jgi:hypothetical protein
MAKTGSKQRRHSADNKVVGPRKEIGQQQPKAENFGFEKQNEEAGQQEKATAADGHCQQQQQQHEAVHCHKRLAPS